MPWSRTRMMTSHLGRPRVLSFSPRSREPRDCCTGVTLSCLLSPPPLGGDDASNDEDEDVATTAAAAPPPPRALPRLSFDSVDEDEAAGSVTAAAAPAELGRANGSGSLCSPCCSDIIAPGCCCGVGELDSVGVVAKLPLLPTRVRRPAVNR